MEVQLVFISWTLNYLKKLRRLFLLLMALSARIGPLLRSSGPAVPEVCRAPALCPPGPHPDSSADVPARAPSWALVCPQHPQACPVPGLGGGMCPGWEATSRGTHPWEPLSCDLRCRLANTAPWRQLIAILFINKDWNTGGPLHYFTWDQCLANVFVCPWAKRLWFSVVMRIHHSIQVSLGCMRPLMFKTINSYYSQTEPLNSLGQSTKRFLCFMMSTWNSFSGCWIIPVPLILWFTFSLMFLKYGYI